MEAEDNEERIKLITHAVQKLLDENKAQQANLDEDDQRLLSKLLSQLESLKEVDSIPKPPETLTETKDSLASSSSSSLIANEERKKDEAETKEMGTEEIVKELRKVRRQNNITHWLLSIMIFVTAVWQLSEVSLMLKVKNSLSHPFKSVGSMITRTVAGGRSKAVKKDSAAKEIEPHSFPVFKIPEVPHLDLPVMSLDSDEED